MEKVRAVFLLDRNKSNNRISMKAFLLCCLSIALSLVCSGQVETIMNESGGKCLVDRSFRDNSLKEMNIVFNKPYYDRPSNQFVTDNHICYTADGVAVSEFIYLDASKSSYKKVLRDSLGHKKYEEICQLKDSTNYHIVEKKWDLNGNLISEHTFYNENRTKINYYSDLNNGIKSISLWKLLEYHFSGLKYQDADGKYWVEYDTGSGKGSIPIGEYVEFHSNGLIKSKGQFYPSIFTVYNSIEDYQKWLIDNNQNYVDRRIDNRKKIGKWEYFDSEGKSTSVKLYE